MTESAPAPAPNPAPAGDTAPNPAPSGDIAPFDWSKQSLAPETLAYVQNKGFANTEAVVTSYKNLEKLRGVPPERLLTIPNDDDPASWAPVYDKLGRPKDVSGYDGLMPKEGGDEAFAKQAAGWFHEAGLSAKQARTLAAKWNEHAAGIITANKQEISKRDNTETEALKVEWGAEYQSRSVLVERAAAAFGMSDEQLASLRSAMGPKAAMNFLHNIGSKLGTDDTYVTGGAGPGFSGKTPAQALERIKELRADRSFVKRFTDGDGEARREMETLHKQAYPGS